MEALFTSNPSLLVAAALCTATLIATVTLGLILAYHLFKFSLSSVSAVLTVIVYTVVSGLMFTIMFSALFLI